MKRFRAALFVLALVSFVSTAGALTPGPTIIRECPTCMKGLRQFTIGSGNMNGSKWWTDGKVEAPMFPMRPELGKCPHCHKSFWIEDAKKLAELSWSEDGAKWAQAKAILEPVEEDYLKAADAPGLSTKRQLHARKRAWWLANDPGRGRTGQNITWNNARRENLKKLSALLDEKVELDVILKAEVARELGQFEACAKLLARPFKEKECESYAAQVRDLAGERNSTVALRP
jgi:hypothetical protein